MGLAWNAARIEIEGAGRWWIHEAGSSRPIAVVDGGPAWAVTRLPFETALRVVRPDGYVSAPHSETLVAAPLDADPLAVGGVLYPGAIEVLPRPDGTVTAVNVVGMETYLEGVVAKELGRPGRAAFEALRAQAVAARTYALKRLGSRAALGFDVFGTVEDQAYGGFPAVEDSLAVRAVRETRGEAIVWNGVLIDAFYHSTCGGQTARSEEVFDGPGAPYLVSVSDARPDGGFWCQESRVFRWSTSWTGPELAATVRRNLGAVVPLPPEGAGELRDMELLDSSPEGRALAVRVTTSTGRYMVVRNAIRRLLADPEGRILRSTLFLFRPVRDGDRILSLEVTGGGWGHGIGMCQIGAMARARAGHRYRDILAAYYTGTAVATLY